MLIDLINKHDLFLDVNIKAVPEPARVDWVPPNVDSKLVHSSAFFLISY